MSSLHFDALRDCSIVHIQKTHGIGGAERHILDLCGNLRARGARPSVLWLEDPRLPIDRLLSLSRERGVMAERLSIMSAGDRSLVRQLRDRFTADPPRLVHAHLIHATFHAAWALRGSTVALVATRHSTEAYQKRPWLRLIARWTDARCARVIAPSRWVAEYARRWDGTPAAKLRIVEHGVDLDRFAAAERSAAGLTFTIGAIARLHPAKDHETLLCAYALLAARRPQTELVLVGDGPLRSTLEQRAAQLMRNSPAGRVRFAGERDDVEILLAGFDATVLPGDREGFGLAALEAMAAGVPVVAPNGGALPELINDGDNGLLVRPHDAAHLAATLERLIIDPGLRAALARAGMKTAQRHSAQRMAAETAAVYIEALAGDS